MAAYTYSQSRRVLPKLGFTCVRSRKHETWEKILEDETVLRVRLFGKGSFSVFPKSKLKVRNEGKGDSLWS